MLFLVRNVIYASINENWGHRRSVFSAENLSFILKMLSLNSPVRLPGKDQGEEVPVKRVGENELEPRFPNCSRECESHESMVTFIQWNRTQFQQVG